MKGSKKLKWVGFSIQKWAEEVDFLKNWVRYMGFTQTKIGKLIGVHKSDVSTAFSLEPRNKRIVPEIIDMLGLKMEEKEDRLLLKDKFYFLHAVPVSVFTKWSSVFFDLGLFLKRNYKHRELSIAFLFNPKVVPYTVIIFEEKIFFVKCEKIKLGLANFLFSHIYDPSLLEKWKRINEKVSVKFRAIPLGSTEIWKELDRIFEEKDSNELQKVVDEINRFQFLILS